MYLVVISGPERGKSIELPNAGSLTLGRGTDHPHSLSDPRISRKQCTLEIQGDDIFLSDCESRGGTFINGQPIQKERLKLHDVILIGDSELRLQSTPDSNDGTTLGAIPKQAAPPISNDLTSLVGTSIHNYRLERVLAKGRNGWVFYAKHTKHDRDLAVKVLYPTFTQVEEEMQRFTRAMKTMFPLDHPNIVRLYNAGVQKPYCWLAMEYVNGEALTEIIRRIGTAGMLPWDYAFRVAVQVARALEAAEEKQIIHRNVSPSSILVRKADQVVKLGDLMLAKAMEGVNAANITRPGELIGEVAYMSPERTVGPDGVDIRSDIYGLGATLYAVLTGRPPFEDASLPSLIQKIRQADPVKPKKYQLSINDMFEGIVLKCLAKRPEDRFQSFTKLLQELNRVSKFSGITV